MNVGCYLLAVGTLRWFAASRPFAQATSLSLKARRLAASLMSLLVELLVFAAVAVPLLLHAMG